MTVETWADIPDSEIDVGSTIRIEYFDVLRKNQAALREHSFLLRLDEQPTSPPAADTWEKVFDFDGIWVPGWADRIIIAVEGRVDAGTGTLRFKLGANFSGETAGFTNTTYDATVLTMDISGSDVTSLRRTIPAVELQAKNSGANVTYARNHIHSSTGAEPGAVSHFEQAA